jgi:hypothetical protein
LLNIGRIAPEQPRQPGIILAAGRDQVRQSGSGSFVLHPILIAIGIFLDK